MVTRSADVKPAARSELVVQPSRSTAAIRLAENGNSIVRTVSRISTQRVLADEPVRKNEVDMGPRIPCRQVSPIRCNNGELNNTISDRTTVSHNCSEG